MDHTYWHKQLANEPLFPDLLWSRPENKQTAGKLLIIGGNIHSFAAVGQAYSAAQQAGAGTVRVVLPDVLQKTISKLIPEAYFVPSTPSGSFSQKALAEMLELATWADGVVVAGDLGRNSETAILLEKFVIKYDRLLILTKDGADYFTRSIGAIINRNRTVLVLSFAQLQRLAITANFDKAFTFDMGKIKLIEHLHEFTIRFAPEIIIKHIDTLFVAMKGEISTTTTKVDEQLWRVPTAAAAAVWRLQNPSKPFEALTTSVIDN